MHATEEVRVISAFLMRLFFTVAVMCASLSQATAACSKVKVENHSFELAHSGQFCVEQDITRPGEPFAWMNGGETSAGGAVGYLGASNTELDLQGHTIVAKRRGVSALHDAAKRLTSADFPVGLLIRNGKLISETGSGVVLDDLFGQVFLSLKSEVERFCAEAGSSDYMKVCLKDWYDDELGALTRMKRKVPRTGHRLEELDVTADRIAVAIKGSGNVVRNSQLKVTGCGVSLYLIGGNQLIENNTIVVSGARCSPADAPIKLHLGDNSVIRNNTIIIEGWGDKPEAAISVIDSQGVQIENNTVLGAKALYKIWDETPDQKSVVTERGNDMKSSWRFWK